MDIFLFDGSVDGFYTAVFDAYPIAGARIMRNNEIQLSLTDVLHEVSAEPAKATQVEKKIKQISASEEKKIRVVLRCGLSDAPERAYRYLRLLLRVGASAPHYLSEPAVLDFRDAQQKVSREVDHLRGFIRFQECTGNVLYAPFSPDNDILELLLPHFARRLNGERFILHDVKRKKAVLYRDGAVLVSPLGEAVIEPNAEEDFFQRLWVTYYHSVNIPERKNSRQMKQYMPTRYWKFLTEKETLYSSSSNDFTPPCGEE